MKISDMQEMDEIVKASKSLSWDGWDVVHIVQDDSAEFLPTGTFDKLTLQWYKKTVFTCTEEGWEIPESVM